MVDFGNRLKELRLNAGLSQKQLADKLWITKVTVSYYELSERNPSPEILIKIAKVFHVTTDYLLGIEDKQKYLDVSDLTDDEIDLLQHTINVIRKNRL